jgi:hypothetical protein
VSTTRVESAVGQCHLINAASPAGCLAIFPCCCPHPLASLARDADYDHFRKRSVAPSSPPSHHYAHSRGAILSLIEFSNHMNFKFGLGRFSWLLVTPQNHRIHHSRLEEHVEKNFAAFFPLWDVIFGTYYAPKKNEYPPTGLASGEHVTTFRQALFLPFLIWRRMLLGASSR